MKINTKAEVLDIWGDRIPNLYAAGMTTGGWKGEMYPGSGSCVSYAVVYGRIAGENIGK